MNENSEILKKIKDENYIWIVYLVIIGLSFYSNSIEKKYYQYGDSSAKEKYRQLNILIFSIALAVYIYFYNGSYQDVEKLKPWDSYNKKFFNKASLTASTLILISGVILLFIALFDENLDTEIAFS